MRRRPLSPRAAASNFSRFGFFAWVGGGTYVRTWQQVAVPLPPYPPSGVVAAPRPLPPYPKSRGGTLPYPLKSRNPGAVVGVSRADRISRLEVS